MTDAYTPGGMLDMIKIVTDIEKFDDAKILIDTGNKLVYEITLKYLFSGLQKIVINLFCKYF